MAGGLNLYSGLGAGPDPPAPAFAQEVETWGLARQLRCLGVNAVC
jgi:hypothetical protein